METDIEILKKVYRANTTEAVLSEVAKEYLKNTDFFELRELRGGKQMPNKVRQRRAEAIDLAERKIVKHLNKLDEIFYDETIDTQTAFINLAMTKLSSQTQH
jgi:hypothetical protein